jgi:putative hydrolase of the HAD superfamily
MRVPVCRFVAWGAVPAVDAVLFDLDDTLVDWATSVRRTVADLGGDELADRLLGWAAEHCWTRRDGVVVARNTWKVHEFADETWPLALPELDAGELALALQRFREELWVGFFPDVVPTLDVLVDVHRLGILSNNPYLQVEVERLRLRDWFEVAVDVPRDRMKPHPEAFAMACTAMRVVPDRTVYVGDSIAADVEGALGAGLIPVWLDRHDEPWEPPAGVHRIGSLAELPDLLAGW